MHFKINACMSLGLFILPFDNLYYKCRSGGCDGNQGSVVFTVRIRCDFELRRSTEGIDSLLLRTPLRWAQTGLPISGLRLWTPCPCARDERPFHHGGAENTWLVCYNYFMESRSTLIRQSNEVQAIANSLTSQGTVLRSIVIASIHFDSKRSTWNLRPETR